MQLRMMSRKMRSGKMKKTTDEEWNFYDSMIVALLIIAAVGIAIPTTINLYQTLFSSMQQADSELVSVEIPVETTIISTGNQTMDCYCTNTRVVCNVR